MINVTLTPDCSQVIITVTDSVATATNAAKNGTAGAVEGAAGAVEGAKNAVEGAAGDAAGAAADAASKGVNSMSNALNTDMSDDEDLKNMRPGGFQNNSFAFLITKIMSVVKNIGETVGSITGALFAKFIFAATFPALPFFLIMGSMYSFVKYGAFKLREI